MKSARSVRVNTPRRTPRCADLSMTRLSNATSTLDTRFTFLEMRWAVVMIFWDNEDRCSRIRLSSWTWASSCAWTKHSTTEGRIALAWAFQMLWRWWDALLSVSAIAKVSAALYIPTMSSVGRPGNVAE